MTTLRVILDEILVPAPTGLSRYAEELTRALIDSAPPGCDVAGIVSSSPQADYDALLMKLPGLGELSKSALARRELTAAWQHGFTRLPSGMVHAPSLLAPLSKHDRASASGHQIVVTAHDAVAWTHPDSLPARRVAWHEAMAKRAERFADAVVVPTHAVADVLAERFAFGDRLRVIGGAVSPLLALPTDADDVARRLDLPERFILTAGGLESRKGIDRLVEALGLARTDLPLLALGNAGATAEPEVEPAASASTATNEADDPDHVDIPGPDVATETFPPGVRALGELSNPELAVVFDRAALFVYPTLDEGFGLPMLEAFRFGTPVIHSDAPALVEVAGGAGLVVAREPGRGYASRLAEAVDGILDDETEARRLSTLGSDRASLFSWRASAEKVWQLHADL